MYRKIFLGAVMAGFLATAAVLNAPANAQIVTSGGGGGFDSSSDQTIADDDIFAGWGDDNDFQIEWDSAGNVGAILLSTGNIRMQSGTTASDTISFGPSNSDGTVSVHADATRSQLFKLIDSSTATGLGISVQNITATFGIMNGSDTVSMLRLEPTNANHTGTSNTVSLIEILALTGDANSNLNGINIGALTGTAGAAGELENAIQVAAGWDNTLYCIGSSCIYTVVNTGVNHVFNAGTTPLMTVHGTTAAGTQANGGVNVWGDLGIGTAKWGAALQLDGNVGIMDGSDTLNFFRVNAFTNGNHTGTGNTLNLINLPATTGDANANLNAIHIGALTGTAGAAGELETGIVIADGWDHAMHFLGTGTVVRIGDDNTSVFDFRDNAGLNVLSMSSVTNTSFAVVGVVNQVRTDGSIVGLEVLPTLGIMNGSDTYDLFMVDVVNVNHTGTGNTVNLISTDAITGDANTNLNAINIGALTGTSGAAGEVETAILFGDGWDYELRVVAGNMDFQLAANNVLSIHDNSLGSIVQIRDPANATGIITTMLDTTVSGSHFSAGGGNDFGIQNGADVAAFFRVDGFTDNAATGAGNYVIGLDLETITTPDADTTKSIIRAEGGWDFAFVNDAALGTDAWTTANDKTALAKSGTLRVEISGTVYHIQLYADS